MFLFYLGAKEIRGEGSLKNMRETIEMHVHGSKNVMFAQAKDAMMKQLRDLMLCHIWYFLLQSNETRNTATQTYMSKNVNDKYFNADLVGDPGETGEHDAEINRAVTRDIWCLPVPPR